MLLGKVNLQPAEKGDNQTDNKDKDLSVQFNFRTLLKKLKEVGFQSSGFEKLVFRFGQLRLSRFH